MFRASGRLTALCLLLACSGPDKDIATDAATSDPGGGGGLALRLPYSHGEAWILKRAYNTATHVDHSEIGEFYDDRFALDFALPVCGSWDQPVLASARGIVLESLNDPHGWGDSILVQHDEGCVTRYSHLHRRLLGPGERVEQGDLLGQAGNSGHVEGQACDAHRGTHLHFALYCQNDAGVYVGTAPEPISGFTNLADRVDDPLPSDNDGPGVFEDGWHSGVGGDNPKLNGDSGRFWTAYRDHSFQIGSVRDNGGGAYVHDVRGVLLQDFFQDQEVLRHDDSDGWTALILNKDPGIETAFLIRGGFWGTYKCLQDAGQPMGGATLLGPPTDEEHFEHAVIYQRFRDGYMSWDDDEGIIRVHLDYPERLDWAGDEGWRATSDCVDSAVVENPPVAPGCSCTDEDEDGYFPTICPDPDCAALAADCDDSTPSASPGNPEHCDGIDSNCDGEVDEGCDEDGDGYCAPGASILAGAGCTAGDCNDAAAGAYPGANETCQNGIDDNCDGQVDEACGAVEVCDGVDNDGDGSTDEGFDCVRDTVEACPTGCGSTGSRTCGNACLWGACAPPAEACNAADDDCDGSVDEGCVLEVCDGVDNDGDGSIDEGYTCVWATLRACVTGCGSAGVETCNNACLWSNCVPPAEVCNGADDNCDGQVDEGCVLEVCDGVDNDGDGQVDEGYTCIRATQRACVAACGSAGVETCTNACTWGSCAPPAETCNGVDDDCDGTIDDGVTNSCINYATCLPVSQCAACPAAPAEACGNGVDDNCDGRLDEGCVPACDVPAITWTQLADLPAGGGEISVGGVLNGLVYVAGLGVTISFYSFDPVSETWTQLADMPEKRDGGGGVGTTIFPDPDRFYVLGEGPFTSDVLFYDPALGTWDRGAPISTPRSYFGTGLFRSDADAYGLVYAIGGWGPETTVVERYDSVNDTWSAGTSLADARGQMATARHDRFLYAFGGSSAARIFDTVERLREDDLTWETRSVMPRRRHRAGALVHDTHIYVMGGTTDGSVTLDATDAYDPTSDSWCDGTPLPEPLHGFLAVTVANEFYVFGGTGPADASSRVYRGTFP